MPGMDRDPNMKFVHMFVAVFAVLVVGFYFEILKMVHP
jgi:hypothetical protein